MEKMLPGTPKGHFSVTDNINEFFFGGGAKYAYY